MIQLPLFAAELAAPHPGAAWLTDPTTIVVSVSGGLDSAACAIWARRRWPRRPLIFWHAHLAEMDWPQTDAQLLGVAEALGNCCLISVQPVYALNGERTPTGANGTTLRRLHIVRDGDRWFGPAQDDDSAAILSLLDFSQKARNGQPPTSKLRWCTSYFKVRACDIWLRANRDLLGDRPLLLSGERHAESVSRAKLPPWEWRFGTRGWDVVWHRPVVDLPWHEVVQMSVDAAVPIHPGYFNQGETLERMLDPTREERGRARLSCVSASSAARRISGPPCAATQRPSGGLSSASNNSSRLLERAGNSAGHCSFKVENVIYLPLASSPAGGRARASLEALVAPTFYFAIGARPATVDLETALAVGQRDFLIPVGSTITTTLQQLPDVQVVLDSAAWPSGNPNRPSLEQYAEAILGWRQADGSWGNLSWAAVYDHIGDPARTRRDYLRLLALLAEAGAADAPIVPVTHYPGPAVETILLDHWHEHAGMRSDVVGGCGVLDRPGYGIGGMVPALSPTRPHVVQQQAGNWFEALLSDLEEEVEANGLREDLVQIHLFGIARPSFTLRSPLVASFDSSGPARQAGYGWMKIAPRYDARFGLSPAKLRASRAARLAFWLCTYRAAIGRSWVQVCDDQFADDSPRKTIVMPFQQLRLFDLAA